MGNCMEVYSKEEQVERSSSNRQEEVMQKQFPSGFVKEDGFGRSGMRVKIVLPKEELEWFMSQLDDLKGKRLEDVLGEIEKGMMRVKLEEKEEEEEDCVNKAWKPSLESILESPEIHGEMER